MKLRFVGVLLIVAALILFLVAVIQSSGSAESESFSAWVLCQPNDYINVREKASRRSMIAGRFDPCDEFITDGTIRNGYLHIIGMGFEARDSWIHAGYVVYDEPESLGGQSAIVISHGKLAARRYINGKIRKWLKRGTRLKVYYLTDEWAVTNQGFVKTQFIELEDN